MSEQNVPRLKPKNRLTLFDVINSTLAQMAPAAGIYYGLPVIFIATGVGSPLTILLAAIAVAIVGMSLTNFSKTNPSSGSLIKYIGMTFGGVMGTACSLIYLVASIFLAASAFIEFGGWTADSLALYGIHVHWVITTIVLAVMIWGLTVIGIDRSTKIAAAALCIEVIVLSGVSILILISPPIPLSMEPFLFTSIKGGLSGIGLAFPLAVYLFIGFENSVALSEETENPGRNTTRAVLISIALIALFMIFVAYSIIQGFSNNAKDLSNSSNPFMDLASAYLGKFSIIAIIAGFTSIAGMTIACLNAFSRVAFNSSREELISKKFSRISKWQTPATTLSLITGLGLILAIIFGLFSDGWISAFGYLGSLGTIPVLIIYALLNLAVIVDKKEKWAFHRKYPLPIIGIISIMVPIWAMVQPGQPAPASYFPLGILILCIVSFTYAWFRVKIDPELPVRIGTLEITDQQEKI